jgi:hypothetical protein
VVHAKADEPAEQQVELDPLHQLPLRADRVESLQQQRPQQAWRSRWCNNAIHAQPGYKRADAPVSMRHCGKQVLAARASSSQPRHVRRGPNLIQKYQLRWVQPRL